MTVPPLLPSRPRSKGLAVLDRAGLALTLPALFLLAGCGDPGVPAEEGIPVEAPELRPYDGLLESPVLQEVVELGIRRDGEALRSLLGHDDPLVRARAAFSLASVADPGAEEALVGLLSDPDPGVRGNAAFALGHLEPGAGGGPLADALQVEEDPTVRRRLLEALGSVGDEEATARVLALGPGGEEGAWTWSLVRSGLRQIRPAGLVEALLDRLDHPDPTIREQAAYHFGRGADEENWTEYGDRIREALDGYAPDDPAAQYLVLALARLRDRRSLESLLHWLEEGEDWRTRVSAARALGATGWLESPGVRPALFRALEDESEHVGRIAAQALTRGFMVPPDVQVRMARHIQGPPSRWRTQAPLLQELALHHDPEGVLAWTRRMVGVNPRAVGYGLQALADIPGPDISAFIREAAAHEDPFIRGAAFAVLARRWPGEARTEDELTDLFELFVHEMREGPEASAIYAASPLFHPAFLDLGSADEVEEAYRLRVRAGDVGVVAALVHVLGEIGDDRSMAVVAEALEIDDAGVRRTALRSLEEHPRHDVPQDLAALPRPELRLDWELLASLGPEPRLRIRTEKGNLVIRMAPDQAPLTVQTLARQAMDGLHDGVMVHRVEPGFLFQAGDYTMGDGTGSPGYGIRTEITGIPFRRGVAGMASAGRDTEGSQYFVAQALLHQLDGHFTSFGWVESGTEVLDRTYEGDRILEMTVEPGPAG